mgnify:CR=1 FL=1
MLSTEYQKKNTMNLFKEGIFIQEMNQQKIGYFRLYEEISLKRVIVAASHFTQSSQISYVYWKICAFFPKLHFFFFLLHAIRALLEFPSMSSVFVRLVMWETKM